MIRHKFLGAPDDMNFDIAEALDELTAAASQGSIPSPSTRR
jgi:hypothetical protein